MVAAVRPSLVTLEQASVPLSTFIPRSHPHLLTPVPAHPFKTHSRRPQRPPHISLSPSSHQSSESCSLWAARLSECSKRNKQKNPRVLVRTSI